MKKLFQKMKEWARVVLIALVLAILIKNFVFESDSVLSSDMETAIYKGDYVFVSKLAYGPRLPRTILSFPFFEKKIPFTRCKSYLSFLQLPSWRIPGFSTVKRNDVVAFNYPEETALPIDKRSKYMMRCAAIPGDTVKIIGHQLFINNREVKLPASVNYNSQQEPSPETFPQNNHFPWTMDHFGPLWVPGKGKTVKLTLLNYELYRDIIENEENYFELIGNRIYINSMRANEYTFKQNYYFMLDDSRDNAKDSRFWGFLPESHIIGKAMFVWFSLDEDDKNKLRARWGRFFKRVNIPSTFTPEAVRGK
jgi:signal peptidase I